MEDYGQKLNDLLAQIRKEKEESDQLWLEHLKTQQEYNFAVKTKKCWFPVNTETAEQAIQMISKLFNEEITEVVNLKEKP